MPMMIGRAYFWTGVGLWYLAICERGREGRREGGREGGEDVEGGSTFLPPVVPQTFFARCGCDYTVFWPFFFLCTIALGPKTKCLVNIQKGLHACLYTLTYIARYTIIRIYTT